MPTDNVPISLKGTARRAGTVWPPDGSIIISTGSLLVERSDTGSQFAIRNLVVKFQPSSHPGATGFTYTLTVNVSGKNDTDGAVLIIQSYGSWSPPISASD